MYFIQDDKQLPSQDQRFIQSGSFYIAVLLCNLWAIIKRERNITAVDMRLIMIIEILLQNIYFIDDG